MRQQAALIHNDQQTIKKRILAHRSLPPSGLKLSRQELNRMHDFGGGMARSHRLALTQTLSRHFAGMIDAHKAG